MEALVDDLERYLSGHPVRARRPTLGYRFSKLVQRHRRLSWVTLVGAGLVVVLASWAILERQRATRGC